MNSPKLKRELIVEHQPGSCVITVDVGTKRAYDWVAAEGQKYCPRVDLPPSRRAPGTITLVVSPCYDAAEVKAHLEYPEFTDAELE